MHQRKSIGNLVMHLEMCLDGFIWELFHVISLPVPLHSSGKEGIKERLNSREWHGTRELEDRSGQGIGDGVDMLLSLLSRSIVARNKGADFGKGGEEGTFLRPRKTDILRSSRFLV